MSATDLCRSRSMPASMNTPSEASSGAAASTDGLLSCQAATPAAARNCGSMRKRELSSWPHQPARRAPGIAPVCAVRGSASVWRWCTKQPPIAPGPAFRYL